jgi:5-methylcytosine-specific restriction endonuclease McrA
VKVVWVELVNQLPVRICKNQKAAVKHSCCTVMPRADAVRSIRRQIWERDEKCCTHCGVIVPWGVFEMHERIWRGRAGEISVENGTTLCNDCHQNDPVAGHGNRRVRFGESPQQV